MDGSLAVKVAGESLELLPERAVYWPNRDSLILSDLHLGRVESLQQKGRPIPAGDTEETIRRLQQLNQRLNPGKIIVLGDLFHHVSSTDFALKTLVDLMDIEALAEFILVPGNHDRQSQYQTESHPIQVRKSPAIEAPFVLTHEPLSGSQYYNLAGHLHPMIDFESENERLRRPCFRFDPDGGVLPAFTQLANGVIQEPAAQRRIYAEAGDTVIECH